MSTSLEARLKSALDSRRIRSNLRSLEPVPTWAPISGSSELPHHLKNKNYLGKPLELIDFSSNDYLSFSASKNLQQSLQENLLNAKENLMGPSSSRLLDGNTPLHQSLEKKLIEFFKGQSGLLFNSGFDANVSIWSTIPGPDDWVVYDNLIHASIHDGIRLSRTQTNHRIPFEHNSLDALEHCLRSILLDDPNVRSAKSNVFISVESLYSMDGDLCPLDEMVKLVNRLFIDHHNAYLVVDEAHSTGLFGSSGRGLVCALSLENQILIRLHTFGKAAACTGAIAILPNLLREYLINYARPLIFSTAMTRMNVIGIWSSIKNFKTEERQSACRQLQLLYRHFSSKLAQLLLKYKIDALPTNAPRPSNIILTVPKSVIDPIKSGLFTPIIPILTREPRALANFLYRKGLLLRPIGTPTVPPGREQVRSCLHANQTIEQIDYLVQQLDHWILSCLPQCHL